MFTAAIVLLLVATEAYSATCSSGIPETEITAILNVHNALRRKVSDGKLYVKGNFMPAAATPIPDLTWDCAIAANAQKASNRCVLTGTTNRTNLGENVYTAWRSMGTTIAGKGNGASYDWSYQFTQNGWASVNYTQYVKNTGISAATQMVWAKTTKIGCGITLCMGASRAIVICQYQDEGNILNENVYEPVA